MSSSASNGLQPARDDRADDQTHPFAPADGAARPVAGGLRLVGESADDGHDGPASDETVRVGTDGAGTNPTRSAAGGPSAATGGRPSDRRVEWVRAAVAKYERPLTQYCLHILGGDLERARDLVQESFLRLCDQDQDAIGSHVAEWLYTVCRNLAIDQKRKDRRMRLISEEQEATFAAEHESPTDAAERVDAYGRVVEAIACLPPRQQEIVRLKFQHGMSYKQIADVMKLTPTNVGFILHTAIKALRDRFADVGSAGS